MLLPDDRNRPVPLYAILRDGVIEHIDVPIGTAKSIQRDDPGVELKEQTREMEPEIQAFAEDQSY